MDIIWSRKRKINQQIAAAAAIIGKLKSLNVVSGKNQNQEIRVRNCK